MDVLTITIICIAASLFFILIGVPIAYVLGFCAVAGIVWGMGVAPLMKLGVTPFTEFYSINWTPLPLFMLMAYIISETDIGKDIFGAAHYWLARVPGGLAVTTVWAEAAMAATMGASGTTILTVGKIALPEMERLGYNKRLSMGALLSGGVLGPLIPPSLLLIVYGVLAQQSISQLFIAGVVPGILLAIMLSSYVVLACLKHPEYAPRPVGVSWKEKFVSLQKVWPVVVLMVGILGGIYMGVITATEAGGIGALIVLIIAVAFYRFRWRNLVRVIKETATLTGMICIMIISSKVLSFLIGSSGMIQGLSNFIANSGLNPWLIIVFINIIILFLGCIMDGLAILLVSMPIFIPLIIGLGFDPVWFGVLVVVNLEIGLITPPVGLNLFFMKGVFNVPVSEILRGVAPFIV
ncbi:MAG: TRAP transporter large permease subunit, partial [Dehalococcoidia bacterium]